MPHSLSQLIYLTFISLSSTHSFSLCLTLCLNSLILSLPHPLPQLTYSLSASPSTSTHSFSLCLTLCLHSLILSLPHPLAQLTHSLSWLNSLFLSVWLRYQTAERLMKKDKRAVIDPSARCNYNPSSHSDAQKTTQIAYFLNSPDAEQQANDRLETQERVCCLLSSYAVCVCFYVGTSCRTVRERL